MSTIQPISNVLAANRGEIAVRIFRACTELGLKTTAIYSWEDRLSIHRYKADRAYQIGKKGAPVASYLDQEALIALALKRGVDAIHPGYGFLSENADFAARVIDAGLTWIGPSPETMRALGDKVSARKVAQEAGVPVVPGSNGAIESVEEAKAFAKTFGFPVLLKAAHGGGGRGMRVVNSMDTLGDAFDSAQREALAAFGSPELFIERYLDKPRHIEVQILGDQHGNIVHLFERDCSVQRRHQKVVEIAPAPELPDEVRQKLYDYSLRIAKHVNYYSAGTVEFLVQPKADSDEYEIFFIEVNTRIQVEHTVTEMITGHDLIKAMIRVAEGYRLSDNEIGISSQEDLSIHGQAIQARITTEDPENQFAPDSGTIITYRSAAGFGIRLDAGVGGSGAVVLPYYDSLLVKVSAHGLNLQDAANKLDRSLAEFRIRGVKSNIRFLQNVIRHPTFLSGQTWTRFVDDTRELFELKPRQDRGNKALKAIGDIIINGPPGSPTKLKRPTPLIEPELPEVPYTAPPESPAYKVFREQGASALSKWILEQDQLLITDTTFRDAHQSLLATRVRTRDLLDIAPATAHALPELFSYEMWGGATFDVCMRFLQEDPWERLAMLREEIPGSLFQMLLRGANAVGYKNYPDNVVRAFVQEAATSGIDVFRIFDALNYVPNMELAIEEVNKQGKIAETSICYTGDVLSPKEDKYTLQYYIDLAKTLEARGAHILNIKDMAGLLKPASARALIKALKDHVGIPVHLHTHDTSGNGVAMYLMASEAGVDIIDCALSSMAGLTSQPSLNAVVTALQNDPRQPKLSVEELQKLSDHWETLREIYYPFESGLKASTTDVYVHEIPGGQYSNLKPRAIQLGLGDRWTEIKKTYHDVNQELGNIVKVTPTSKVVADFSMFLVQNNLKISDIYERHAQGESLDFPQSVKDFFGGYIGQPHGGFPKELQEIVLRGEKPLTERPGKTLDDYNWEASNEELELLLGRPCSNREAISYALYPAVFKGFAQTIQEFGEYRILDTVTFLYGLELGEERVVTIEDGKTLVVKLTAIGAPSEDGIRKLYFQLNGQPRQIEIQDKSVELSASSARQKADKTNPEHVGASMPGKVLNVRMNVGDEVSKGDVIATSEAMKMETTITSPHDGTIQQVLISEGDQIGAGDLIAVIKKS